MLQQEISKKCADSLRKFTQENYKIKLKASHAHELVATYFGYRSKNALLADQLYSISRIAEAVVFIMIQDSVIDKRRKDFIDLSEDLPDSYSLGEAVYAPLFSDESLYKSEYPPFRSYLSFAKYYIDNSQRWRENFQQFGSFSFDHIFDVVEEKDFVLLAITHTSKASENEYIGIGKTTLKLPRAMGKVGFLEPEVNFESWSGQARKHFKLSNRG
ncbi:hypothetical protein ABMA70_12915 [Halobacteriovorax sp. XZX-3]|uniref:hypothetical protein n=1 Tax=unclassified Halobacteriovorax TaxID=2639665 RepID=UPI0037185978